jgi:hypothetical protein
MEKHPDRGKVSKVLRALVQMYLDNKINKLEFTVKEIIGS